ncbi:hypothetical protein [Clostridium perfringens]|uniref:hypothetical protein n=1 Tax=Clostridium perfringens TaxID=1502 RepID=UPI0013E40AB2|nr:hypothetical protein [Clostridium perfringens]EHR0219372.1 hypothetical protein [Clostridium perfringens]EJT6665596.1 hypothetical protein [Clostridium perfringens]MDM0769594.1 hypothetical protein [Clostridium perfringens]NGT04495.1 hypothetical protein [Clostridium perfringens]HBI6962467.1 hypothetical protein [Clostridium perfringens]
MQSNNVEHIVYHGTERTRGEKFIDRQAMEPSIGNRHWLGDGSYFYKDLFYSYKWINDMYISRNKKRHKDYEELISQYKILCCIININKDRIFDLDENLEHKLLFDEFKAKVNEHSKYKSALGNENIWDGIVLNIMFNEYGYTKKYDLIVASFVRREIKNNKSRLNHVLEKQICVKNLEVISKIRNKEFKEEYTKLEELMDMMKRREPEKYSKKRNRYSKEYLF